MLDKIEACMLSVGDFFQFEVNNCMMVCVGFDDNLQMPLYQAISDNKIKRLHPFRAVYVNNFYKS